MYPDRSLSVDGVGVATILGAFGGVMCGGALGAFAVVVQIISNWFEQRSTARSRAADHRAALD